MLFHGSARRPLDPAGPVRALAVLLLAGAALLPLACGSDEVAAPTEPASREVEAASHFGSPVVVARILQMFDGPERLEALTRYGSIRLTALSQGDEAAIPEAFDFLAWTLDLLQQGKIGPSDGGNTSPEEGVAKLFRAIFRELGVRRFPIDPGAVGGDDYVVGVVGPGGGKVTVPSGHAAIAFDPGHLSGPTGVVIRLLPGPNAAGDCPAGFPSGVDCYPLFFDYSLFPETNVTGTPRIGQCVLETGPFAPNATVEARLRIASPSHANPGTVVFWPITSAPTTVDCSDLAWGGGSGWWAALDPVWTLFSPDPLYANPGRLGASVSTFTPFAPADPGPTGPQTNGQIDVTVQDLQGAPESAFVEVFRNDTLIDSDATDANGMVSFTGLLVEPGGTDYEVEAENDQEDTASDQVTLTPNDPDEEVTLVITGPVIEIGAQGEEDEPTGPSGLPQEWVDWLERFFD